MNKNLQILTLLFTVVGLSSCLNSYNIDGSADHSGLDNSKVYLRIAKNDQLKEVDSTEVVHGKFGFSGTTDSTRVAYLVSDGFIIPLVLEGGDITVKVNKDRKSWGGTTLNDKLYKFFSTHDSLTMKLDDLEHEYTLAFMDGEDMRNDVIPRLSRRHQEIIACMDSLFTESVTENFDNILGPFIFMVYAQGQRFPEMSPWVVDIMSKASDKFKNDPDVKRYIDEAQRIQNQANGLESPAPAAAAVPQPPTPNEMAAPAIDSTKVEKADTTNTKQKK
ncbi:MAG: DUF4369 domain-containing protein [Prevotella sp.]|nr:DUF4369 domain-containing protein [Prevotella sp.]